jgi:hypothetical protein
MLLARPHKSQYTENEAAEFLGVSVEQLRTLVQKHILADEAAPAPGTGLTVYQRSDLLLLRLLRSQQVNAYQPPHI